MLKTFYLLIFVFCFICSGFAQESLIIYPKPFQFEKINGTIITDAIILYEGDKKNLSLELNGLTLKYVSKNDSLKVKLPLIGNKMYLVFKQKG